MSTVGKALVCNSGDVPVRIITSHGETLIPPGVDVEIPVTCDENWQMSFGVTVEHPSVEIDDILQKSPQITPEEDPLLRYNSMGLSNP